MDKIYDRYEDQHERATYVYVKADDAYAYADELTTVKIEAVILTDLFRKGIIIVDAGMEYKATSLNITAGVVTLAYVKADETTATTAVLAVIKSSEYVA